MTEQPASSRPVGQKPDEKLDPPLFPEQDDALEPAVPLTARRVAIAGARVVTGFVGIGVAFVMVAGSALLPLPTVTVTPPSAVITPVPTAQQLVCPGAVLRLADETGQGASTASAIGAPSIEFFSSTGVVEATPLDVSDASTGGTSSAPTLVSTPPDAADPTEAVLLSGAQSQSVSEAEFVGLAAADCGVADGDTWLVGGSTAVGRTTLLTLSNPTEVPATVDLTLYGENGLISAPGTSGIVVAPSGQRVLSLAGFQPDVASPVVHVVSTGGQVVAELQQSIVRGLEPGGVEIIGPTRAPSLVNVIPGLRVTDVGAVQKLLVGGSAYDDLGTIIRIFAPGEGTIATTISVVPEDGESTGASFSYDIDAGRVTDVPIGDLTAGSYTIRVEAASPLIAAARVSAAAGVVTDFAWLAAPTELNDHAQFTVPAGPAPVLHLTNPAAVPAAVTLTPTGGSPSIVEIAAGASVSVPVQTGKTYAVSDFETIFAAVSLTGSGAIARFAVHPPGVASTPVTIYR